MKIKWLGHASFLITTDAGVRIITDPYQVGGDIKYGEIKESADIVTVSHEHSDHNNSSAIGGKPTVIKGVGSKEVKGIKVNGIATHHDKSGGRERGNNTVFCFDADGMRVCHLGDLGHVLSDKDFALLGKVDLLLLPVGGFYTIDARDATDVFKKVAPKVTIPMHYKTERCTYPISGVDGFLKGKTGVEQRNSSEVELKRGGLPATAQIIVLKPAL